jgi:response regulator NasT
MPNPPVAKRVVIAEDEALIRMDLKEILETEGYDVVGECGRGDEAVRLVGELHPDLAILDVKMPGMDGIEAARRITASHYEVAVLILTAFSQRNLIEDARDAGVVAYLVKPFQRGELVPAIEVALARFEEFRAIEQEHARLSKEVASLEDKLETRRVVDRAKGVLMDRDGMTEKDSFTFIQRSAMDRRIPMRQVAQEIIDRALTP